MLYVKCWGVKMANNYDNYGYEDDKYNERSSLLRRLLIILMIVFAIVLIILLIKGCSNKKKNNVPDKKFDYEATLLEGAKKYFDSNYDKYPSNVGKCEDIELQALIERNYVNASDFSKCNTTNTYVNVCKMENGSYHFYPWLVCTDKNSSDEYGSERIGTYMDVVPNNTVVSFEFMPQKYETGDAILGEVEEAWKDEIKYSTYKTLSSTTYYRYRDRLFQWKLEKKTYYTKDGEVDNASSVKEYYSTSPSSSYTLKTGKTDGYKWYTTNAKKVYAVDSKGTKLFSHNQITNYPYYDNGVCTEYQTRTETGTTNAYHYYKCSKSKNSTTYKYLLNTKCEKDVDGYTYQVDSFYTCGYGQWDEIEGMRVGSSSAQCKTYSTWKNSINTCDPSLATCRKIEPYCVYNWYRIDNESSRKYVPSGGSTASAEKIYYTSQPVNGAIKDTATKTTVYKWYKITTKNTTEYTALPPNGYDSAVRIGEYKYSDWTDYSKTNPKASDGRIREIEKRSKLKIQEIKGATNEGWNDIASSYMNENDLISFLQSKGYNVNSLDDIENNGDIKLKVQMLVRNKKENR